MGWIAKGLAAGIANLVVGWLLTATLVMCLALNLDWARELERKGVDTAMRWSVQLSDPLVAAQGGAAVTPVVFIDVDEAGCNALSHANWDCRYDGLASPALLRAIGPALRNSEAALVVLDLALPPANDAAGSAALEAVLAAWSAPVTGIEAARAETASNAAPVLAALPVAPGAGRSLVYNSQHAVGMKQAGIRFAPAMIWQDENGQSVIRHYPDSVDIIASGGDAPSSSTLTLPSAAAMLLNGEEPSMPPSTPPARRVLFSLPSLAVSEDETLAGKFLGTYERRLLSSMLADPECSGCPPAVDAGGLAGQLVIIGSGAPAAADRHLTPLGVMAGAEVVANTIRSIELVPSATTISEFTILLEKLRQTLPAALIVLAMWLAIAFVRRSRPVAGRMAATKQAVIAMAIYLAGLGAALALSVYLSMASFFPTFAGGGSVDLLLPTLALFMEGFVEFAALVSARIREVVAGLVVGVFPKLRT